MLRAHANMPIEDFISQLRTYVIAMGLSLQVVDCVDNLTGANEFEDAHAKELEEMEAEAERRGRESMKKEIADTASHWLEKQPNYDMIAAPCEALLKEIEGVEI